MCRATKSCSIFVLCGVLLVAPALAQETATAEAPQVKQQDEKPKALRIAPAVRAFLNQLSQEQKAKAKLDYDSEQRVGWHFIPKPTRKGLPLMEMDEEQQEAAMKVLRAAISAAGFDKATKIMQLEGILLKLEGPESASKRNPLKYYFTVFGQPGAKKKWGLSIEGHHLSLNFVFEGSKCIDSTPQFFATNPAMLKEDFGPGFEKGLRVLRAEEQLGFALVKSLSDEQKAKAMLPGETPQEIRGAGDPQPPTEILPGIAFGALDEKQQEALKKLIRAYTSKMKSSVAKERWALIEDAGMGKIQFSWSGATRQGIGHYYVVQGPTFVIEFINVQPDAAGNPANHVHCVWRDMGGDFDLAIE